jgi:hypothetical protein
LKDKAFSIISEESTKAKIMFIDGERIAALLQAFWYERWLVWAYID